MRRNQVWIWAYSLVLPLIFPGTDASTLAQRNDNNNNNNTPDLTRLPALAQKPRIFILSDILNEVDDSESLVRFLLYSNEFSTQGICAVTSQWLPNATYPGAMKDIINAYGKVVDNLNHHVNPNATYQNASALLSLVTSGPKVYGKEALSQSPSEGALLLVQRLEESSDPLWIVAWGGVNTLAQALQYIHNNYPEEEATSLRSRLRMYAISDQDDAGPWIRLNFPDVFYIVSVHAWNSYNAATWAGISQLVPGSNTTTLSDKWLADNIQIGVLGAQYPTPMYVMEGDTPSFLYLIQNGLGHPEYPHWGGWGGRWGYLYPDSRNFHDTVDAVIGVDGSSYTTGMASVWRWRGHFQHDFAARMQWTLTSDFWNASHPPVPVVNGTEGPSFLNLTVQAGQSVILDASQSYDPDHPETLQDLTFQWYQYREPTEYATSPNALPSVSLQALSPPTGTNGTLPYNDAGFENVVLGPKVQVTVPGDGTGLAYHIILQLTSKTAPLPLTRYLRVLLNV